MHIKKIIEQTRRDFTAIYICEHCNQEEKGYGYDDTNFHKNIIPTKKCKNCGKVAGNEYNPLTTKYPDHFTI